MNNLKLFSIQFRFSAETAEKWDAEFIERELEKYKDTLKRVWACGPF